jgi:hypothetical protein
MKFRSQKESRIKLWILHTALHVELAWQHAKMPLQCLFTSAKVSQLAMLPQGKVERKERAEKMVAQMDAEGFGACTNIGSLVKQNVLKELVYPI